MFHICLWASAICWPVKIEETPLQLLSTFNLALLITYRACVNKIDLIAPLIAFKPSLVNFFTPTC